MTRKLRYLCTLLLMAVASGVWADTSTVTASKITDTSVSWNGSAGEAWSVSVTGGATGQNLNNGYAQVGTSKNPSKSITLSTSGIKGTITSIVVDCASYNGLGTISATVDGSAFGESQAIPKWVVDGNVGSGDEVTFSNATGATGNIVITMTNGEGGRAMYIKSITVTWSSSITATVAAPTFDPAGGTYTATQNVTISCATAGADIYYTLDGNDPTTASTKYTGPISIPETKTLKAFAVKEGMNSSAVTTAEYTINKTTDDLVTDVMTAEDLVATGSTYTDFSNVSLTSNAVYAGQSAKANGGNIQLRSKNNNSGIVTTASGGTISSITIDVADATNTIDVYGRNTAYTSAGDLYGETPGTLLGSILSTGTIEVTGSYAYVGVRSRSGAVYISSIEFKWIPASDTPTAATPSFSLGSGTYTGTQTVSISCETAGATIYYTLDGSDPTTSSTLYSEPIAISADATLKAIAVASDMENSAVATADYIIIDPNTPGASEATAYTVAEAIEFINGLTGTSAYDVYVKGTISRVQSYSEGYKSITYWISDDGTTSSEMQVYNGKGVDKADFSNIDDLQPGDQVTVCGIVKDFNGTPEFDTGNYLVSFTRPVVPRIKADNVTLGYEATSGIIEYEIENPLEGVELVVEIEDVFDWISNIDITDNAITFTTTVNSENTARSATIKLLYSDAAEKDVTVTQAGAPVVYYNIPDMFEAATKTATDVLVKFDGWVVTGVSSNGKTVFVSDGTNGFIIFGAELGFEVGNTLTSSTPISCKLQLFNGSAEITELTASTEGLTVGTGGSVGIADITMANLAGVNTGALVSYKNLTCSVEVNNEKTYYYLSDETTTLQVYNTLFAFGALEAGKKYDITGVYQQYSTNNRETKEILPRNAEDIKEAKEEGTISTGINNVEQTIGDAAIYNLNGVRVNKVQKGVYVVNGKKVVIK